MLELGHDHINASAKGFEFPREEDPTAVTRQGERPYVMAGNHTIGSRDDFERYSSPEPAEADHRPLVEAVHERGKPMILHSCGNLKEVMDTIIACGWDAKHSFEDVIEPVWTTKEKHGDEISVMGGFDMDKISRMTVDQVRAHTRRLMERCAPGGRWCLGTGNTVANYILVENFLAMLDEGRST